MGRGDRYRQRRGGRQALWRQEDDYDFLRIGDPSLRFRVPETLLYDRMLRLTNAHTEYGLEIGWVADNHLNHLGRAKRVAIERCWIEIRERLLATIRMNAQ